MITKTLSILIFISVLIGLASGQSVSEPSRDQLIMMSIFVLVLLLFAAAPMILNMYWAYGHLSITQNILKDLIEKQKENKTENDAFLQVVKEYINAKPSGITGIGRSTMALTLTVIVGISLIYLFVYKPSADEAGPIRDLLLTVIGALSSIIGFYFGGRAHQGSAIQPSITSAGTAPTEVNIKPYVTDLAPDRLSPQVAGTTINWTATAIDPDGDQILYKYFLKGPSTNNQVEPKTQGWIKENTWAWVTTPTDVGMNLIEVWVRDGNHAGEEEFDSRMIVSYQVTAMSQ